MSLKSCGLNVSVSEVGFSPLRDDKIITKLKEFLT